MQVVGMFAERADDAQSLLELSVASSKITSDVNRFLNSGSPDVIGESDYTAA